MGKEAHVFCAPSSAHHAPCTYARFRKQHDAARCMKHPRARGKLVCVLLRHVHEIISVRPSCSANRCAKREQSGLSNRTQTSATINTENTHSRPPLPTLRTQQLSATANTENSVHTQWEWFVSLLVIPKGYPKCDDEPHHVR